MNLLVIIDTLLTIVQFIGLMFIFLSIYRMRNGIAWNDSKLQSNAIRTAVIGVCLVALRMLLLEFGVI